MLTKIELEAPENPVAPAITVFEGRKAASEGLIVTDVASAGEFRKLYGPEFRIVAYTELDGAKNQTGYFLKWVSRLPPEGKRWVARDGSYHKAGDLRHGSCPGDGLW